MAEPLAAAALPEPAKLFLDTPLYEVFTIPNSDKGKGSVLTLVWGDVAFDAHCIHCGSHSPFKTAMRTYRAHDADQAVKIGFFDHTVECQRNKAHKYRYFFKTANMTLTKIGQWPSLEDVAGADIEKYRPLLKKHFGELKRATGLASHGIGIGSFVYLRRIFERLIWQHHDELPAPIEGFSGLRMDEKIGELKAVLPPALVKHKATYAILSKGLHELDEQTCLKYFPVVRAAIIQILEQDFRAREARLADETLAREIAAIHGELKVGQDAVRSVE
ncbi:hypothetical protein [Brevundimonas sp.]|uniref:hypothetical protein n=1 Tax=Brevundimonas sp. TaxID=1871086 RepID=UPI003D0ADA39